MAEDVDERMRKMSDFRSLLLTSIISAFALVVGLFWNDAIKSAIDQIVPQGQGLFYKFLAAVIVTVIVVVVIYILMHSHQIAEKKRVEFKTRIGRQKRERKDDKRK